MRNVELGNQCQMMLLLHCFPTHSYQLRLESHVKPLRNEGQAVAGELNPPKSTTRLQMIKWWKLLKFHMGINGMIEPLKLDVVTSKAWWRMSLLIPWSRLVHALEFDFSHVVSNPTSPVLGFWTSVRHVTCDLLWLACHSWVLNLPSRLANDLSELVNTTV